MLQGYIKYILLCCILAVMLPCVSLAASTDNLFVEGRDYIKLPDSIRNKPEAEQLLMANPHKVQVLFFFSYACHGCHLLDAPFQKWSAQQLKNSKNKVAIYVYPVSFNAPWAMLAKMYYINQTLDPTNNLNEIIFNGVQKQGLRLWEPQIMKRFFVQHGYNINAVDIAASSFTVNRLVKRADDISKAYNIIATPDIVINGPVHSYKLDLSKAGNDIDRVFRVLDYLVAKERKLLGN